ncbi:hypothetical protein C4F50_10535 [Flavobacterium sp. KB82]|uniref:Uncharacterized protein n=2 Tax=Flavobacterium hungaricum TaxID=2082725 RepID=A0ABR9TJ55_9FLAO|nr:hypothetical protein [Flavobacterium hungaricum]
MRDTFIKNEIEKNGKEIIVKFTLKDKQPKITSFYFAYFINGKKISSANSGINYSISNSETETRSIDNLKINAFYLAKSISKYPTIIIVNPLKQVTDTIAILKAGFSREEIIRLKFSRMN